MKSYTITVNGNVYDVTVEENGGVSAPAAAKAPTAPAAPKKAPAAPAASGAKGSVEIKAGAAGKVFKIESAVGKSVSKGDTVLIIEAMKMEIPLVAPQDGVVASIDCSVGEAVEAGAVVATLK